MLLSVISKFIIVSHESLLCFIIYCWNCYFFIFPSHFFTDPVHLVACSYVFFFAVCFIKLIKFKKRINQLPLLYPNCLFVTLVYLQWSCPFRYLKLHLFHIGILFRSFSLTRSIKSLSHYSLCSLQLFLIFYFTF